MAWHPGQEVHEGDAECTLCSEVFDAENLIDGVCRECCGHEFIECEMCGEWFERRSSPSETVCSVCLDEWECSACGSVVNGERFFDDDDRLTCGDCLDARGG